MIALVVTGKDAESTEAGSTTATTTSSAPAFRDASDELSYADRKFLRGISPLIKRNATDEELLDQADFVCSKLESSSKSEIQTALIATVTQVAAWQGEEAFYPGTFPDASTDLLS